MTWQEDVRKAADAYVAAMNKATKELVGPLIAALQRGDRDTATKVLDGLNFTTEELGSVRDAASQLVVIVEEMIAKKTNDLDTKWYILLGNAREAYVWRQEHPTVDPHKTVRLFTSEHVARDLRGLSGPFEVIELSSWSTAMPKDREYIMQTIASCRRHG